MKKFLSLFAAMLVAFAVNAQGTDFAAPGYSCAADDAVLTGGSSSNFFLDTNATPHHIAWSDVSLSSNALATWTITATRGCYVSVSLDLGPVIASNKHIFEVKILDDKSNVKGKVAEPAENTDSEKIKTLADSILIPAAGTYTVELRNNRDWGKGTIKNVILTYVADAPGEMIAVDSIILNKKELSIEVEEVELLEGTVYPDNAFDPSITWTSSDPTIATVSETGLVTGIAAGKANITAKAGEKTDVCAVTVVAATIPNVDFAEPLVLTGKKAHLEGAIWKNDAYKLYGKGDNNKNYGTASWTINVTKPCTVVGALNGVEGGHIFVLDVYDADTTLVGSLNQPDGKTWSAGEIALDSSVTFAKAGKYILKLRNTQEWSSGKVAGITLASQEPVLADGFYLLGKTGWDLDDVDSTLLFKVNPANDKEYILHILLAEKDSFKIVKVEDDGIVAWYPDQKPNYAVDAKHAGEKDIYFRPDGQGGADWYEGVIYIAPNADPQPVQEIDSLIVVFKNLTGSSDGTNGLTSTNPEDYITTGADYFSAVAAAGKVYNAQAGYGLKFGNSSSSGSVTLTLKKAVKATSLVISAAQFGPTEGSALLQDSVIDITGPGTKGKFATYSYDKYDGTADVASIIIGTQTKRGYVNSLKVYFVKEKPAPEVKYYMKNNWDAAADWTWKEMTKDGDNYKLEKVVFGGSGVNYNTAESDEKAVWVELAKFKGDTIAAKDTVTLVLNPADSTITATLLGKHVEPAPEIPTILFKTVATTDTMAGAVYADNEYINIKTVYKGTIVEHNATVFGEAYTHAIQVRVTDYPSKMIPTGTLHANGTPLVITAKKDGIIKLYYVRQAIDKKWEENDNKDVILFDQAAPTEKLKAAEMVEDSVLSDSSYYYIGKVYELKAGKTYTLAAKGTTLKLLGFAYPGEAPEPKHTYTVAGSPSVFGSNWNPADTINDMKEVEKGIYLWAKNDIALAPGNIEFKICEDHAWTKAWPAQNYVIKIDSAGLYTVAIYFTSKDDSISAMAIKTGEAVVIPKVILHGDFTGSWADTKEFTLADDSLSASLKLNLGVKNYEFGMKFDGTWKANGAALTRENPSTSLLEGSGNMHVNADVAGEYIFTYTFEAQTLAVTYPAKPADGPEAAPAEPTLPANQVKAVYSAKYEADCDFGEWGSGTVYTQETVGKKYVTTDLGYFGLTFDNRHLNCSKMEKLHLDVWIAKDTTFRVVPIWGGAEQGIFVRLEAGKWNAIDIALADFDKVTSWSDVYQIKIDEARNMTFWLNNVYFYTTQAPEEDPEAPKDFTAELTETSFYSAKIKANATDNSGSVIFDVIYGEMIIASAGGESGKDATITVKNLAANGEYIVKVVAKDESGNKAEPIELTIKTLAAPAPAHAPALDAANVVSLYSDAYTPAAAFEDMNQSWWMGPALIVEDELVEGDNVLFYTDFAEGGAFGWAFKDAVDAAGFQKLHLDIYPTAATSFTVWPVISPEDAFKTTTGELVANQWNEVIIDLSDKTFAPFKQFGWVIAKSIPGFFVDNVYFFKDAEGIDNTDATVKAVKVMENGQILIIKNGKTYNVLGTLVK